MATIAHGYTLFHLNLIPSTSSVLSDKLTPFQAYRQSDSCLVALHTAVPVTIFLAVPHTRNISDRAKGYLCYNTNRSRSGTIDAIISIGTSVQMYCVTCKTYKIVINAATTAKDSCSCSWDTPISFYCR